MPVNAASLVTEPEGDFALSGFDRVRAVNDVATDFDSQITTNRTRRGFERVRRTNQQTRALHHARSFPDHRDNRTRANVVDQVAEERLGAQVAVVLLSHFLRALVRLQSLENHTLLFESGDNLTDVATLHAIRPNHRGKTNKEMKSVSRSLSLRRLKSARSHPPAPRVVAVVNHPIPPHRVASSHASHALNHNVRPLRLETSRANDASVRPRRRRSAFVRRRSNLGSTERRRARHASRHLYQCRLNVKRVCLQSKVGACGCSPSRRRRRRVSHAVHVEPLLSTFSHFA